MIYIKTHQPKFQKIILLCLVVVLGLLSCNSDIVKEPTDNELTTRQIVSKYYYNKNFWVGVNASESNYSNLLEVPLKNVLISEFPSVVADSDFLQMNVYPVLGDLWNGTTYRSFFDKARKQKQFLHCTNPISYLTSDWVSNPSRSNRELEDMLTYFSKTLNSEIQANNKDVVKWMDVVDNTIAQNGNWYGTNVGETNVWLKLGTQNVLVDGNTVSIPSYIIKVFQLSNLYSPDIKQLISQSGDDINFEVWEKVKDEIKALRASGLRVDGMNWKARVSLGWEENTANLEKLELLIDWCYLNNAEFHITGLEVVVDKTTNFDNSIVRENTRLKQAQTIAAIATIMVRNAGRGAVYLGFQPTDRYVTGVGTCGSLYNFSTNGGCIPQLANDTLKKVLLNNLIK